MIPEGCSLRPFDSEMLGRPVWYLEDPQQAADAVVAARADGVGLIFHRGEGNSEQPLAGAGFRAVETLVTLTAMLPVGRMALPNGCRLGQRQDGDAVEAIARAAFRSDRWHADPAIPDEKAHAFKGVWARNDLEGRAAATLVTVAEDGTVSGFNALLARDDDLIIDLIAVAPQYQGKGMGRLLVHAALAYGAGRYRTIRVGTQAANTASLRLYRSMGFEEMSRAVTWHWTPPD